MYMLYLTHNYEFYFFKMTPTQSGSRKIVFKLSLIRVNKYIIVAKKDINL